MEKNNSLALFRTRSTRAIIADGFRLYTNNFRRLFRAAWPVAVIYALAMALMSSYAISRVIPLIGASQILDPEAARAQLMSTATTAGLTVVLFAVCATLLASCGFSALLEHSQTDEISMPKKWYGHISLPVFGRLAVVIVCLMVLTGIVGVALSAIFALAARTGLTTAIVGAGIVTAGCIVLLIPFCYTVYHTMLDKKRLLPFGGYLTGISHFGTLFVTLLLTGIVTMLLTLIAQLPANILYAANIQSQIGMLGGDEAGMPQGVSWLNFVVFTLGGFIQAFVHLLTLFPFYYAYGSIRQQETERQMFTQTQA